MEELDFIFTTDGVNAVINADATGFEKRKITEIAFGTAAWTPTKSATALQAEIARVPAVGGALTSEAIHVHGIDPIGGGSYEAREVGLFLDDGTLLAVASRPNPPIVTKTPTSAAVFAYDMTLTGTVTPDKVEFGAEGFEWNSASEAVEGLVALAPPEDTLIGGNAVITSAGLGRYFREFADAGDTMTGALHKGLHTARNIALDLQERIVSWKDAALRASPISAERYSAGDGAYQLRYTEAGDVLATWSPDPFIVEQNESVTKTGVTAWVDRVVTVHPSGIVHEFGRVTKDSSGAVSFYEFNFALKPKEGSFSIQLSPRYSANEDALAHPTGDLITLGVNNMIRLRFEHRRVFYSAFYVYDGDMAAATRASVKPLSFYIER